MEHQRPCAAEDVFWNSYRKRGSDDRNPDRDVKRHDKSKQQTNQHGIPVIYGDRLGCCLVDDTFSNHCCNHGYEEDLYAGENEF